MPKNLGAISDPKDIITKEYLDDKLSTKVDAVDGKGLSTNDLTDTLKSNYNAAYKGVLFYYQYYCSNY